MDITKDQMPPTEGVPIPEQPVHPKKRPDTGSKRDLINPEEPDEAPPAKPIPDMDPDGSDPDENESIH